MLEKKIFLEVKSFVFDLFKNDLPQEAVYHNYEHTLSVVKVSKEISEAEEVDESNRETLLLAAWFHDTGYSKGFENHEETSAKIASKFLESKEYPIERIELVRETIMATKMPQNPKNDIQRIICDADMYHLGGKDFFEKSSLLRLEIQELCGINYSELEWLQKNETFLKDHKYFTDYAYSQLAAQKSANWLKVQKDVKKIIKKEAEKAKKNKLKSETVKLRKDKETNPDRGIQTMYRVTLKNHIKLSDIADTKANILLSVNAIILSIVLANLFPKLDKPANFYLIFPTMLFVLTAIVAMIFSVLATRPKVTSGNFTKEDVKNRKVNLLFFGNFHKIPLEDFKEGMKDMMNDRDYLYESLMKDLYYLGIVLDKKYKLLRYAYNIFMFGIILSVIAFIVAFSVLEVT